MSVTPSATGLFELFNTVSDTGFYSRYFQSKIRVYYYWHEKLQQGLACTMLTLALFMALAVASSTKSALFIA
jgi:hypothetical protein